ncbi:hypothetical protein B0T17DRAFT_500887, partial [Bombardia bombarda]
GIFPIASRFNHACDEKRNVNYTFNEQENTMVFKVHRPAAALRTCTRCTASVAPAASPRAVIPYALARP